jgi:small-conductance mechanosensitive channel
METATAFPGNTGNAELENMTGYWFKQRLLAGGPGLVWILLSLATPIFAAEGTQAADPDSDAELRSALVELDGNILFRVRGISAVPAEKRAAAIATRIREFAADSSRSADGVAAVDVEHGTAIMAGSHRLMTVLEADAQMESVDRKVLAKGVAHSISQAVVGYRYARSREALTRSALLSAVATMTLVALVAAVLWLSRKLHAGLERRYRKRVQSVGIQSFQIVRAEQIWSMLKKLVDGTRLIALLVLGFFYVQYVLALFPWTRGAANRLLDYVIGPIGNMAQGVAEQIPDLIFLLMLFFVIRYLLKLLHLFFGAVGRGEVLFPTFEREWADPTYKLLRLAIVIFALVVAYPYIPGSGSEAFKGISIFMGIVFSLGASSAVANLIAGYMLTYRRVFRVGDRVKINDVMGDVIDTRLQVTHLRTIKNEEVIIPNSKILDNEVVNFSSLARRGGLILHTNVGIRYETPWRQVEAMLLIAAERTAGSLQEPAPFVRHQALGDFAVNYEINVYCDDAQKMSEIYTNLHRNILDVFNEYGVQIMTPAYEGDTQEPKVVPKEQWFSAPAKVEEDGSKRAADLSHRSRLAPKTT